jgi:hypothetical protein
MDDDVSCVILTNHSKRVWLYNSWWSMKVQYNSLTMLLSSFMQEFGPISSRVYCIFVQITNNKFVVELFNLKIAIGCAGKNTIHTWRDHAT